MASSSTVLRPQNKNQKDKNEVLNHRVLKPLELKVSDHVRTKFHTVQSFKRGAENQDPNESKPVKGGYKLRGVSRLPVLAKSLQTVVLDSSQKPGHKRWEERPLLGKAQKRKTCTKPVPFNFSQPRVRSHKSTEAPSETASKSGTSLTCPSQQATGMSWRVSQHGTAATTQSTTSVITNSINTHSAIAKTVPLSLQSCTTAESKTNIHKDTVFKQTASSIQKDISTKLGSITLAESEFTQHSGYSSRTAEVKPQTAKPNTKGSIRDPLSSDRTTENTVPFFPDPSALRSILLNEGVKVGHPDGATLRASTCPTGRGTSIYSAQRVPVRKPQTQETPPVTGPAGAVTAFSPDPSALRSILTNDGVKVGVAKTPRMPVCSSGRKTSIYSAQRVPVKKAPSEAAMSGGTTAFSPDPSALRSILMNEGVEVGIVKTPRVPGCLTERKTSIYCAQRVPVKKAPSEAGGAVPFSPDPSAIHSVLLNEGVKMGGTTPRVSTYLLGRGTPIYSAQRVPVKNARGEQATHNGASQTSIIKGTSQRALCSQLQSVRRLNSKYKTPHVNASPGSDEPLPPRSSSSSSQQQGDVVQRLFQEDPEPEENEQMDKGGDEVRPGRSLQDDQSAESHLKQSHEGDTQNNCRVPAAQPFIQAPHRQSVIVFSSGPKPAAYICPPAPVIQLAQHAEQQNTCATQNTAPLLSVQTSGSQSELNSDKNNLMSPGGLCKTKASSLSKVACTLRRRLLALEEMFLDEECATYTSSQQLWPAQPRCSNPVASTLLTQDSTCFVPIRWTALSLSPVSSLFSPHRA